MQVNSRPKQLNQNLNNNVYNGLPLLLTAKILNVKELIYNIKAWHLILATFVPT